MDYTDRWFPFYHCYLDAFELCGFSDSQVKELVIALMEYAGTEKETKFDGVMQAMYLAIKCNIDTFLHTPVLGVDTSELDDRGFN